MAFSPPARVFLLAILVGALFGVFWDIIRLFKQKIKFNGKKGTALLDVIFCVVACVFTMVFFFIFTSGGFRAFVLIGELIGFVLYYVTVSSYVFFAISKFINFIAAFTHIIFKPIKVIILKLEKILRFILRKIYSLFRKIFRIKADGT